jgi:hypothetical protein
MGPETHQVLRLGDRRGERFHDRDTQACLQWTREPGESGSPDNQHIRLGRAQHIPAALGEGLKGGTHRRAGQLEPGLGQGHDGGASGVESQGRGQFL